MNKEIYVPAKRQIQDHKHTFEFETDEYIKIEEVERFLIEAKEGGATHLFTLGENFYIDIDAYSVREETDEEYQSRIKSNESAKQLVEKVKFQEAKEIYLELKDKYEKES